MAKKIKKTKEFSLTFFIIVLVPMASSGIPTARIELTTINFFLFFINFPPSLTLSKANQTLFKFALKFYLF